MKQSKATKTSPSNYSSYSRRNFFGFVLIIFGVLLLLERLINWNSIYFWPTILIIVGVYLILRKD